MDFIAQAVANAVNAAMNWQHIRAVGFVAGSITLFAGLLWGPPLLAGTIDAPPSESHCHGGLDKNEQLMLEDILTYVEMPAALPPAPNIPVPLIWGQPNTISFTPGKPWNQAPTLRPSYSPVQADPWAAIWLIVVLVAGLMWLVQRCCCKRPRRVAAANDNNAHGTPTEADRDDLAKQVFYLRNELQKAQVQLAEGKAKPSNSGSASSNPSEREQRLQVDVNTAQRELKNRLALDAERNAEVTGMRKERSDLQEQIGQLRKRLSEQENEGAKNESSPDESVRKLQGERDAARTRAIEHKTEMRSLEAKVQGLKETIEVLKLKMKDGKVAHDRTADELNDILQENCRLQDDIKALADKNRALQETIKNTPESELPHYDPETITLHEACREIARLKNSLLSSEGRLRQMKRKEKTIKQLENELEKVIEGNPIYAEIHTVFKERDLYRGQLDSINERDLEKIRELELDNKEKAQEIRNLIKDKDKLQRKLQEAQGLKDEAESKIRSGAQSEDVASSEFSEEHAILQVSLDSALARNEDIEQQLSLLAIEKSDLEAQVANLHDRISLAQTQNGASSGADIHGKFDEANAKVSRLTKEAIVTQQQVERLRPPSRS